MVYFRITVKCLCYWSILVGIVIFTTSSIRSAVHFELEDFNQPPIAASSGYVNIDGSHYLKAGISPDFEVGSFAFGFDFNTYVPLKSGQPFSTDLHFITLRKLTYYHEDLVYAEWGRLQNVTFGYGLLMDNYDSASFGSPEFNSTKGGFLGEFNEERIRLRAMWTASKVIAGRVTYAQPTPYFFGAPLVFGISVVRDDNGIGQSIDGTPVTRVFRTAQSGLGLDIGLPIAGDFLTSYIEYAQLFDGFNPFTAQGGSAGVKGGFFDLFGFRAEYRRIGIGFVPSYFNRQYEATSFSFATDAANEVLDGFFGEVWGSLLDGYIRAGSHIEVYKGHEALWTGALGWQRIGNIRGVINYSYPFQGRTGRTLWGDFLIYHGLFDYLVRWKRTYLATGKRSDSFSISLRVNLSKLIPKL